MFTLLMLVIGVKKTFKYQFLPSFDVLLYTGTELYISPWTRIMPYAVGVGCGWYLNKYRKTFSMSDVRKRRWPWKLYFFLSSSVLCCVFLSSSYSLMLIFFLSLTENAQLYVLLIIIFAGFGTSCYNWEKYQCWDCIILYINRKTVDRFFS